MSAPKRTITSTEIGPALRLIVGQSPTRIKELQNVMQWRFEEALYAIESTPTLIDIVCQIAEQQSATFAMANKFTSELLLILLEQRWFLPENLTHTNNLTLEKLGKKIHSLYIVRWYSPEKVRIFSTVASEYLDTIMEQYSCDYEEDDGLVQEWYLPNNGFDEWYYEDLDDGYDERENTPQEGGPNNEEINLVKILLSMMNTYITMLASIIEDTKTSDNIRSALQCENELWRWWLLSNVVVRFKLLFLDHQLCTKFIRNNYDFRENLQNFIEDWDAYEIIMYDSPGDDTEGKNKKK